MTQKNDRIYALKIIMNVLKTMAVIALVAVLLVVFDINTISLLLTVGIPLTLLFLVQ